MQKWAAVTDTSEHG